MKKSIISLAFMLLSLNMLTAQNEIKLYTNGPKESNEISTPEKYRDKDFLMDISIPRMYSYLASKEKSSGTAVLICPGGGYGGVSSIKEGEEIAKWFNNLGVSAFVLYYRMPNGHTTVPLTDAQKAMKIIQDSAKVWCVDKKKIGIMGFSAGGHLASTVGTHFKSKVQRPAFMILAYPVVTMDSTYTHKGSCRNLLGKKPTDELVKLYSNELQVTKQTPPTFIVHAIDDKAVPIANSENLEKALLANKVSVELHKFDVGGHGFGMRKRGIPADNWPDLLQSWLQKNNLIK